MEVEPKTEEEMAEEALENLYVHLQEMCGESLDLTKDEEIKISTILSYHFPEVWIYQT